jgi:hypothetical protein
VDCNRSNAHNSIVWVADTRAAMRTGGGEAVRCTHGNAPRPSPTEAAADANWGLGFKVQGSESGRGPLPLSPRQTQVLVGDLPRFASEIKLAHSALCSPPHPPKEGNETHSLLAGEGTYIAGACSFLPLQTTLDVPPLAPAPEPWVVPRPSYPARAVRCCRHPRGVGRVGYPAPGLWWVE